ncbi:DUF1876 domain-containing protein [Streptomyces pinistramenti]|uniref:DUF1876 domain-containing protein n=1 Tax=Streptomyces pinistramenti TaxID=2884812 RepID=UPI001D083936|nr:DUF1876 domain-containing protein [Streptomyces pinistramenti]MCB5907456.1 DUF1876 domain-containing protein [Streptomyces pinistramenti]
MTKTAEWKVRLYLFEEDGTTRARAVLDTGTASLTGHGTARCSPEDVDIPEIGDELAVARAMRDLAGRLIQVADRDLACAGAAPPERPRRAAYGWTDAMA